MSTFVPSSILGNLSCLARELLGACCWLRVVSVHGAVTLTEAHPSKWKCAVCMAEKFPDVILAISNETVSAAFQGEGKRERSPGD